MTRLNQMGQHELLSVAKSNGVPIGGDLNEIKFMIADKIVSKTMEADRQNTENILIENKLEQDALKN